MLIFQKLKYEDVPEAITRRVLSWSDKEILFDDTGLTQIQIDRIKNYLLQEGYKQV